jgi:rfaE bifunctional protein nucleotidyltransferase chain/domain
MSCIRKITEKIFLSQQDLAPLLNTWKNQNRKIVFTNGCFDILHRGHADYLARASSLGDLLIIGLNADQSVRKLKGNSRPIMDEYSRAFMLASFMFVDAVILFDEDTPLNLIRFIQPDILVKGSDYDKKEIVGADIVEAKGGTVATIDFIPGFSTSSIINKIKEITTDQPNSNP